ncbi:MAG: FAD-dependent oxidoreductase [Actinoallomurus sp.]
MTGERMSSEHADVVVVGSGFGGAVAAYRLAEAGLSVVVLERGQDYPPGTFARTPAQMSRAFWDPAEGLYGLYDVWGFRGFDSVVSSGLGGGSLIYANVLLRKDEEWFVKDQPLPGGGYETWPVSRAELDPHYDAVEGMLGGTPYPLDNPAFASTAKAHAMQDAAAELGLDWQLPSLAVSFAPTPGAEPGLGLPIAEAPYGNLHGVERRTCRLCGECYLGCNDGAKNSLDHTYLSAARHHGADIRSLHEVRGIRPRPEGGYEVDYVRHDPLEKARKPVPQTISCDRLVLAAGAYGTTFLLLRDRARFPGLSDALGTRFSGNGDLLTFLMRATDRDRIRPLDASRGPTITSAIRLPDEADGVPGAGRGAYIEDGGYPAFVDWMIEEADVAHEVSRVVRLMCERFRAFISRAPDTNLSSELAELIGDGALSVSSLPLLGMGRDVPDGVLRLRGGRLDADWTTKTSEEYFARLRSTMKRIAAVLGATYADNPIWFRKRIVTVHPGGGAPMGHHRGEGVCDPVGEVHGFPGLYIADGAALPGAVGPNPSLTIAALSDRMCTRLLESAGRAHVKRPVGGAVNGTAHAPEVRRGASECTSLSFTEEMKGFYAEGVHAPGAGEQAGRQHGQRLGFRLTITVDDVDRFLEEPEHTARAEGWIDAEVCGGRCQIQRGWFNLFCPGGASDRKLMRYRLHFTDAMGRPRTLSGWKDIRHRAATRVWPDTTTLFFRILEGHVMEGGDDDGAIAGAGILRLGLDDFARQLTTFRTEGPDGLAALEHFGRFFLSELWDVYGPKMLGEDERDTEDDTEDPQAATADNEPSPA